MDFSTLYALPLLVSLLLWTLYFFPHFLPFSFTVYALMPLLFIGLGHFLVQ